MDLTILNTSFEAVAVIDTYESFIWTDRYFEPGDFELYAAVSEKLLTTVRQDYYIVNRSSEHVMIVENLRINSDAEDGNHVTISGKSAESILDRRIIWGRMMIRGNLQNGVKELLTASMINPDDPDRKVDSLIFKDSTDPAITNLSIEAQYTGDNLLEVIEKICKDNGIGFKITLNEANQFVFELYAGVDRSYGQMQHPFVVFSPNFENIMNSNYFESNSALKNVTLIGGEGEGSARRYMTVGSGSGLNRREIFTDARDISSDVGEGETLTDAEYNALLEQRGKEKLSEHVSVTSFDGQVETSTTFVYGRDFFNGDIVQIANEYGHETKARVVEIIMSEAESGQSVYPTFTTVA